MKADERKDIGSLLKSHDESTGYATIKWLTNKITRAKFGEVFFVSSFPKYDVEYVTKLLAQFEKKVLILQHHGDNKEMLSDT